MAGTRKEHTSLVLPIENSIAGAARWSPLIQTPIESRMNFEEVISNSVPVLATPRQLEDKALEDGLENLKIISYDTRLDENLSSFEESKEDRFNRAMRVGKLIEDTLYNQAPDFLCLQGIPHDLWQEISKTFTFQSESGDEYFAKSSREGNKAILYNRKKYKVKSIQESKQPFSQGEFLDVLFLERYGSNGYCIRNMSEADRQDRDYQSLVSTYHHHNGGMDALYQNIRKKRYISEGTGKLVTVWAGTLNSIETMQPAPTACVEKNALQKPIRNLLVSFGKDSTCIGEGDYTHLNPLGEVIEELLEKEQMTEIQKKEVERLNPTLFLRPELEGFQSLENIKQRLTSVFNYPHYFKVNYSSNLNKEKGVNVFFTDLEEVSREIQYFMLHPAFDSSATYSFEGDKCYVLRIKQNDLIDLGERRNEVVHVLSEACDSTAVSRSKLWAAKKILLESEFLSEDVKLAMEKLYCFAFDSQRADVLRAFLDVCSEAKEKEYIVIESIEELLTRFWTSYIDQFLYQPLDKMNLGYFSSNHSVKEAFLGDLSGLLDKINKTPGGTNSAFYELKTSLAKAFFNSLPSKNGKSESRLTKMLEAYFNPGETLDAFREDKQRLFSENKYFFWSDPENLWENLSSDRQEALKKLLTLSSITSYVKPCELSPEEIRKEVRVELNKLYVLIAYELEYEPNIESGSLSLSETSQLKARFQNAPKVLEESLKDYHVSGNFTKLESACQFLVDFLNNKISDLSEVRPYQKNLEKIVREIDKEIQLSYVFYGTFEAPHLDCIRDLLNNLRALDNVSTYQSSH